MTNKILISVKVPMIDEEYDIFMPVSKNVKLAINLIVKTINELTVGHYPLKNDSILLDQNGRILDVKLTIKECNLKNGDRLILL